MAASVSRCTVFSVRNYLLGMGEGIYQLDFFYKVTSNTPDLLTEVVLCEGVISWQPEADILVAWREPTNTSNHTSNHTTITTGKVSCADLAP